MLLLQLIALAGVVAAAVAAMMWSSALGERDDAVAATEIAIAERDVAIGTAEQAVADRSAAEADLAAATTEIERLEGVVAANEADLDTLRTQVDELAGQVTDLTAANAALGDQVDELAAQAASAPTGSFDAGDHPEFSRYVGELLSSRSGASPLSPEQQQCFGGSVVQALGLDGFTAGALFPATPEAEFALTVTMGDSADACGIDRTVIFG